MLGLRRGRGREDPYDQPDYSGGVVAVLGAEGKGPQTTRGLDVRRPRLAPAARATSSR